MIQKEQTEFGARPFWRMLWHAVATAFFTILLSFAALAQTEPAIVQPGAPGRPTQKLPPSTRASLPPTSEKDVQFMQQMIMHHGQAVEMAALIDSRTTDRAVRLLGQRISSSQIEEIRFMKRWLAARGRPAAMDMSGMMAPGSKMKHEMLMPGMLTAGQMDALKNASGPEFDRLFLQGMIQHHRGALTMVRELFDTAGAGQDAEIFSFASDVDSSQRAEIEIMQRLLSKIP